MNKNNLSKLKYVYHVYESSDNVIHCEKHPVIYSNEMYLYYKAARKDQLIMTNVKNIYEKFIKEDLDESCSSRFNRVYFEVDQELLKKMQVSVLIRGEEYKLKDLKKRRISLLQQAKDLQFKIDELTEEIEKHKINLPEL